MVPIMLVHGRAETDSYIAILLSGYPEQNLSEYPTNKVEAMYISRKRL